MEPRHGSLSHGPRQVLTTCVEVGVHAVEGRHPRNCRFTPIDVPRPHQGVFPGQRAVQRLPAQAILTQVDLGLGGKSQGVAPKHHWTRFGPNVPTVFGVPTCGRPREARGQLGEAYRACVAIRMHACGQAFLRRGNEVPPPIQFHLEMGPSVPRRQPCLPGLRGADADLGGNRRVPRHGETTFPDIAFKVDAAHVGRPKVSRHSRDGREVEVSHPTGVGPTGLTREPAWTCGGQFPTRALGRPRHFRLGGGQSEVLHPGTHARGFKPGLQDRPVEVEPSAAVVHGPREVPLEGQSRQAQAFAVKLKP